MKKDFILNGQALYAAPDCQLLSFNFQGVLCSSYGEEGQAGANGKYYDDEEDY